MSKYIVYIPSEFIVSMSSIKQKVCKICQENLLTKFGTCVVTVSLFKETYNKEFSSSVGGKPIILPNLLQSIGIFAVRGFGDSLCKKCARKVANCYKLFKELQAVFPETAPQTPELKSKNTERIGETRSQSYSHERSPTGLTPAAKRQKRRENPRNVLQAKKSLFDEKLPEENSSHSIIDDKIRNLMNIPTDVCVERNLPPIVKVYRKACIT